MKITVLDGYALNPGDLSWAALEKLGDVTVYERTPRELILERAAGADILFTNKTPLDAETLKSLTGLKYIGVLATGYNVVDTDAARELGIAVTNVPAYGTAAVAQLAFALLLSLCHRAEAHSEAVRNGDWCRSADYCFWNYPLTELAGKTMGIIGFGTIGRQVANIAYAMGMKVLGHKRTRDAYTHENFAWADLDALLEQSDVVSLHCPLTPETQGIINKTSLEKMKSTAFLLNTSRGPLVTEQDLADALNTGIITGAGLDVLSTEPPEIKNPLLTAKNCIITPHIAWAAREARVRLMDVAVANLAAFLGGESVNRV